LGERLLCKQEVVGSIPSGSTSLCGAAAAVGGPDDGRRAAKLVREKLNCACRRLKAVARALSDIVKRRSNPSATRGAKPRAARYLQSGIRKQGSAIRISLMPDT
jgi:hypothetical protein